MQVYEKQLLATQSQVKYLQAQTNPHFQFNILSMLSLKAKMAGNEEVYEGLKAFSKLMQGKIFREKEIKIKVSEELEIVRFYLYLQKSRYQDKICYEIKVQDDRINQNLIPRLLIEPLVENAVSHGLEPKRGNGIIKIILYEESGKYDGSMMLHICVEDDGVGFDPEKMVENGGGKDLLDGKIEHTHTGLENTKRMLTILYGSFHKFRISGEIGRGTKVEIVIPSERGI
ncbi:histidine kinase [Blautia sp. RD014234]|nr:histidine kinase [Blautia parvula]